MRLKNDNVDDSLALENDKSCSAENDNVDDSLALENDNSCAAENVTFEKLDSPESDVLHLKNHETKRSAA